MNLSIDFFRDEVRCGFYIPTAMKQAWAAELYVLEQIDRICTRHDITYFADWGTILGAVRHGGYIPWDDDLDICMKREDYVKFRRVADAELPAEFVIHDYERKEDHWLFCARVVSRNQICFEEEHLKKYHNFPYMVSVDIFIKDYLYRDPEKEKKRCDEILKILAVADGIVEGKFTGEAKRQRLEELEGMYQTKLCHLTDNRQIGVALYGLAEQQMARVPAEESDAIEQIFPWGLKGAKGLPKEYYEHAIRLPFEHTTIPVQGFYHQILRNRYGDYLQIHKVWNGHSYPFYEGQRENLQRAANFKLPEFTFDAGMLRENRKVDTGKKSFRDAASEYLDEILHLQQEVLCDLQEKDTENARKILPECQQLAIDLGTLTEQVKGEQNPSCVAVVHALESYCEAVYCLYELLSSEGGAESLIWNSEELLSENVWTEAVADLERAFSQVQQQVQTNIRKREEILFLPTGPKQWKGFEYWYQQEKQRENVDVVVLPLPVMFKDVYGQLLGTDEEMEAAAQQTAYPGELCVEPWWEYDLSLHQPDRVYIQDPYDGENPCLSIPPGFYSDQLQQYAKEVVYVPAYATDEFTSEDYCDYYNMKHYVTKPAVIRADRMILPTEQMKQVYVEKLTEFAGADTKDIWENKIQVICAKEDTEQSVGNSKERSEGNPVSSGKKGILYCIGANELLENREILLEKVKQRMQVFAENQDKICVTVLLYPTVCDQWQQAERDVTEGLVALLSEYGAKSWSHFCEWECVELDQLADQNDAYYGSATPITTLFRNRKKPVMISDYTVE